MVRPVLAALPILLLAACAPQPRFDTSEADLSVTPEQAVSQMERLEGTRVLWGGVIVASHNREESTQLEVLGYPLTDRQRPDTDASPQKRFLAIKSGYLETADYAPGRQVTVSGPLTGIRSGRVGKARYSYPVVRIDDSHLWPEAGNRPQGPRFHFGIGVIFGN